MKKLQTLVVLTAVNLVLAFSAFGQSLISPIDTRLATIKFTGFERNVYDSDAVDKKFDWIALRANTLITLKKDTRWTAFSQVDIKPIDTGGNYLKLAYVQFAPNTNYAVRVGRNFSAAPYYTTPVMPMLETVRFPREPWGYYGYSIQTEGNLGKGWCLIADISGASDRQFQDEENFDRVEASWRIAKKFGKVTIGQVTQVSSDFVRAGLNFKYRPANTLEITGEYYHEDADNKASYDGGYILADWSITKNVALHLQGDEQVRSGNADTIVTAGIALRTSNDRIRVLIDYVKCVEKQDDKVLGCLQFMF